MERVPHFSKKNLVDIILCYFFMRLDHHEFSSEKDPMMSSTWLSICAMCPSSARCRKSMVALLTNQEGDMWASHC
jgi:hypothetical protein